MCSDRGRYPIVPHITETSIGSVSREVFPSLIVFDREEQRLLFGAAGERVLARPGAEARYGTANRGGRLFGSVAVESVNQHRQVLDHVVVDVARDAPPFGLRVVDDHFAFDCGLGRQPGHRSDREDPQRDHH